jgi:hypothetical protein
MTTLGTYFEFLNQDGKRRVACIIKATQASVGWTVDANFFIPFSDWESNYEISRFLMVKVVTSRSLS